jgi:KaiC/GvpD/RAD55 family RecA-like ATPase
MKMMKRKINTVKSGLALIDKAWGGMYKGGTYLLIGPRKSGRTLMGLHYAMECVKNKEVCLYFTNMRPKDLMIHAASIDFDLQAAMNQNLVIVVRVAPPTDIYESESPDNFLVEYLNDIVTVIEQYQPDRLVFDELTPFVGFENISLLQQTYLHTIESIEERNVTCLMVLAEPATPLAQMIVDSIAQYSTAIIYLQRKTDDKGTPSGKATITPNIGHTEGQFVADFYIEPYKGIVFEYENQPKFQNPFSYDEAPAQPEASSPFNSNNSKYRPITNVDVVPEKVSFTNLYDVSEFSLILNNQIAFYKSTGQPFTLISLKLDPIAERQRILTINQLQNAVRLSTDKKDKLCVVKDKILVLMGKGEDKTLNVLVSKIKQNLPNSDPNYLGIIMKYIYAFSYDVNERVVNAESILSEILEEEIR